MKLICLFIFFLLSSFILFGQKNLTTVGIQIKPIFPVSFLGTGPVSEESKNVKFETSLHSGFSGGIIIRQGLNNLLALETGISYVKRNYDLSIVDSGTTINSSLRMFSYEIPLMLMVYAQVGEKIYMNGSMGPSINMYPSNLVKYNDFFTTIFYRDHIFQPTINGNIGAEYRTEKSGFFYFGISYQRPFNSIFDEKTRYQRNGKDVTVINSIAGSYLTIDLRYYFHEEPKSGK